MNFGRHFLLLLFFFVVCLPSLTMYVLNAHVRDVIRTTIHLFNDAAEEKKDENNIKPKTNIIFSYFNKVPHKPHRRGCSNSNTPAIYRNVYRNLFALLQLLFIFRDFCSLFVFVSLAFLILLLVGFGLAACCLPLHSF